MSRSSNDANVDAAAVIKNLHSSLSQDVVKDVLSSSFTDNKMKISADALSIATELAKSIVTETCLRAANQGIREGSEKVDLEHIEKCLPQLMLDFP